MRARSHKNFQTGITGFRRVRSLVFAFLVFWTSVSVAKQAPAHKPEFLWNAPASDTMGGSVFSGYSLGESLEGVLLGARALFFFDHFVGGISADMSFLDDGTSYSMILQTDGRYGPIRAGLLFGMKWLPGRGDTPAPAVGLELAVSIPLGIDGIWLDLAYRPGMILFKRSQMVQQSLCLGLVIEAGL